MLDVPPAQPEKRVAQTCFLGLRLLNMGVYQIVTTSTWRKTLDVPPSAQPEKPQT